MNYMENLNQKHQLFLTTLPKLTHNGYDSSTNPYFTIFASETLCGYQEVLMWRDYDPTLGVIHNVNHYINRNGGNTGFTREFVDNFLMANGLTGSIVFRGVEAYLNYIEGKGDFLMQEPGKILVRALKRTHI